MAMIHEWRADEATSGKLEAWADSREEWSLAGEGPQLHSAGYQLPAQGLIALRGPDGELLGAFCP